MSLSAAHIIKLGVAACVRSEVGDSHSWWLNKIECVWRGSSPEYIAHSQLSHPPHNIVWCVSNYVWKVSGQCGCWVCVSCGSVSRIHNSFRAAERIRRPSCIVGTWKNPRRRGRLSPRHETTSHLAKFSALLAWPFISHHIYIYIYKYIPQSYIEYSAGNATRNSNMEIRSFKCRSASSLSLIIIWHNTVDLVQRNGVWIAHYIWKIWRIFWFWICWCNLTNVRFTENT